MDKQSEKVGVYVGGYTMGRQSEQVGVDVGGYTMATHVHILKAKFEHLSGRARGQPAAIIHTVIRRNSVF